MRAVQIHLGDEFLDAVGGLPNKSVGGALGYLACWAIQSERYKSVVLYGDKDGNIHATYRDGNGEVTYSMFALRAEDGSYSTHS
jgi:hypothetical protein